MAAANIRDKIKKLLALANDKGASENEAAVALEFATKLMMQHGIEQAELNEMKAQVKEGEWFDFDKRWHVIVGQAVGRLYGVKPLGKSSAGHNFRFVGRPDNLEAANATVVFVAEQIEALYKAFLPRGMSKQERAEYRRDFKYNCALRVNSRAAEIVEKLTTKDDAVAVGCTALVVVSHREQLDAEIEDFFEKINVRRTKARSVSVKISLGGLHGAKAGDQVRLQKGVR